MEDAVTEVPSLNHNSENGSKGKEVEEKVKDKDTNGGGGGVINNFISTLMTPLSPRIEKPTTDGGENGVFEKEVDENGGGRKGVISNLVSNIFHRSEKNEEGVVEKEDEEIKADEKVKRLKTENESNGDGGGGFIHDIVSHLPTSIPGNNCKMLKL